MAEVAVWRPVRKARRGGKSARARAGSRCAQWATAADEELCYEHLQTWWGPPWHERSKGYILVYADACDAVTMCAWRTTLAFEFRQGSAADRSVVATPVGCATLRRAPSSGTHDSLPATVPKLVRIQGDGVSP